MRAFNLDPMRENGRDRDDKFDFLSFFLHSSRNMTIYDANLNLLMFSGSSSICSALTDNLAHESLNAYPSPGCNILMSRNSKPCYKPIISALGMASQALSPFISHPSRSAKKSLSQTVTVERRVWKSVALGKGGTTQCMVQREIVHRTKATRPSTAPQISCFFPPCIQPFVY